MNYFDFFEMPLAFSIDEEALKRQFYKNSKNFHPDFHTQSSEEEQDAMLEKSTLNNQAFQTLSNQDKRIKYILDLKGLLGDEANPASIPQDFLMEMMEINEKLMELEFDFDARLHEQISHELDVFEEKIATSVQKDLVSTEPPGMESLERVRDFFLKKRYLLRIRENLSKFAGSN
jgi:molecular chaperone HscB